MTLRAIGHTAKQRVLKKHPEAECVLDHFPGLEGYRVWILVRPKHWRGGPAHKTARAAWREAADRLASVIDRAKEE